MKVKSCSILSLLFTAFLVGTVVAQPAPAADPDEVGRGIAERFAQYVAPQGEQFGAQPRAVGEVGIEHEREAL